MKSGAMTVVEAAGGIVTTPELAEEIAMVFFNAYNSDLERLGDPVVREAAVSWIVEIAVSDPIRPALGMPEEGTFVIEMRKSNCQILDLAVR